MTNPHIALLTREYPPEVYGGAGTHVEYLTRELRHLTEVSVQCWGAPRTEPGVTSHQPWAALTEPKPESTTLQAISIDLAMAAAVKGADLVHSHTWYANFGGHLAKLMWSIPHVMTIHSLEPLRPWKAEQLGGGYALSMFCERTGIESADAVIAVSRGVRQDVLDCYPAVNADRVQVIHNGIDLDQYRKVDSTAVLKRYGIDPDNPYLLFVGRITRQKGFQHLLRAIQFMDRGFQIVLCAAAPDTLQMAEEMKTAVDHAKAQRSGVIWINEMVDQTATRELYSHAAVFVCPSIYEPFGIINLEAMACETAVVASAVGGIKEVVVDGKTGFLVPLEQTKEGSFEPANPEKFARDLAERVNQLMKDRPLRERFGKAGRRRVGEYFSWASIAQKTKALYETLVKGGV